jgi:hypothetical protein
MRSASRAGSAQTAANSTPPNRAYAAKVWDRDSGFPMASGKSGRVLPRGNRRRPGSYSRASMTMQLPSLQVFIEIVEFDLHAPGVETY